MSRVTLACLIIDDPLLRPQYGALNYKELLKEMKIHNFFTEIAFIPWNYNRSHRDMVKFFHDNRDRYALCVHGCDHVRNEFGVGNYEELSKLSSTALWRMEQHKQITGLPYDPVMVFPQGRFSSIAMKVLKEHGYLAAFNSTLRSTDGEDPPAEEYRQPATMMYHGFPLFLRRYPKDREKFLDDIRTGRPVVIVEHHGVFKDRCKEITDLVDWINSFGNIRWTSLLQIAEHYLKQKAAMQESSPSPYQQCLSYRSKVAFRRYLSEMRDNHVETNKLLSKIYRKIMG